MWRVQGCSTVTTAAREGPLPSAQPKELDLHATVRSRITVTWPRGHDPRNHTATFALLLKRNPPSVATGCSVAGFPNPDVGNATIETINVPKVAFATFRNRTRPGIVGDGR
jgi:hypothetical protein